MKKTLLIAAATLVSVGAFAQGKLAFDINSDNVIFFTSDASKMLAADRTTTADTGYGNGALILAGQSLYTGNGTTPGAVASLETPTTFIVALYGGSSAGSMTLQTTTTLADVGNPGGIVAQSMTTVFPAGTPVYFQEQVYDSTAADAAAAWAAGKYAGVGVVFQATPSASINAAIYGAAANSTLAPNSANFVPTDLAGLGFNGGIAVYAAPVPEPGTFALAGLGLAALLVLRRRS